MFAALITVAVMTQSLSAPPLLPAANPAPPSTQSSVRSARLRALEPLSAPHLLLRMGAATLGTAAGAALSVAATFGVLEHTLPYRFPFGALVCFPTLLVPTLTATMLVTMALTAVGSAVGGGDFLADFQRALPIATVMNLVVTVAAVAIGLATGAGLLAALVGVAVTGVATPLAVELSRAVERAALTRRGVLLARFD